MDLLKVAIDASLKAGKEIISIYNTGDYDISIKTDNSPLTKADAKSNLIILDDLEKTGIPVLSEESKEVNYSERKNWSILWIVDPLDGTKEFIKRNGDFTVNIALVENGTPVLGVIYAPVTGELFYSDKMQGSFKTTASNESGIENIMETSDSLPLSHVNDHYTLVVSRSHMNRQTEAFVNKIEREKGRVETISRGSSLKICMIAEGKADCYPRFAPTMEWDTAAGHAIAKFAGKSVKSVETGKELIYNKEDLRNPGFIVE